ncbi:sialidase-4-like [Toxotes jaculatrix]|uniref:sialidase-4-like n=1 Tax=Toxotes jaculatrix TaxID=941984 RepID=UPI001B3B0178|nr:sialidase-4-like [Toxotes jaculatrix]
MNSGTFQKKTVFKAKVYRIPALFYDTERETLLAFAEQRETTADTSTKNLVMAKGKVSRSERSIQWTEPEEVKEAHLDGHRPMNPCPVYDKKNSKLFLFFICIEGKLSDWDQIDKGTNKTRLCYITSEDHGDNWSEEVTDLTDKLDEIKDWATFAVGPGHGLQTESGRLIVPVYAYNSCCPSSCFCFVKRCCTKPYVLALYSDDSGVSWQFGKMLQTISVECQMAEFFDEGNKSIIYCNARSEGGYRVEAASGNDGGDFSQLCGAEKLVETCGGCQGSVVSFPAQSEGENAEGEQKENQNKWLLFTHPSYKCKRINLGVYLNKSPKSPSAWSKPWIINHGPSGYSDLAYIGGGWFACLMECGETKETEQIASVVFSYKDIEPCITDSCLCHCL